MTNFERAMINDIKYFLDNDYNVNEVDLNGKSLLHYAVLGNAYEVINELIRRGINIDKTDKLGETPFFDCARKSKYELAKLLIVNNTNINIKNNLGESPIHLAAAKGDKRFINLLLEANAIIDPLTNENLYPVHYAVTHGQINIIKYILNISNQSFLIKDNNDNTLLHYASKTTNDLLIYYLISEGLNPNSLNKDYETPLFNAVKFGSKETIYSLLENDAYISIRNKNSETPIDYAHIYDKYQLETVLTNYQMLPKYERLINKQALTIATLNREYSNIQQLIKKNHIISRDKYNYTAYDYAKMYQFKEAINILKTIKGI